MVELHRNIRLRSSFKTKGVARKKGQIVTLVDYPVIRGKYYTGYCTVHVKGYGRVRVPKNVVHKTVVKDILRKAWRSSEESRTRGRRKR